MSDASFFLASCLKRDKCTTFGEQVQFVTLNIIVRTGGIHQISQKKSYQQNFTFRSYLPLNVIPYSLTNVTLIAIVIVSLSKKQPHTPADCLLERINQEIETMRNQHRESLSCENPDSAKGKRSLSALLGWVVREFRARLPESWAPNDTWNSSQGEHSLFCSLPKQPRIC